MHCLAWNGRMGVLALALSPLVACGGGDDSSDLNTTGTGGASGAAAGSTGGAGKAGSSAGGTTGASGKGGAATGGSSTGGKGGGTGGSMAAGGSAGAAAGGKGGSPAAGGSAGAAAGGKGGSMAAGGSAGAAAGGKGGSMAAGGSAGAAAGGSAGAAAGGSAGAAAGGSAGAAAGGSAGAAAGGSAGAAAGGSAGAGGSSMMGCDAVGTTYFVDPINGDDATATGSGTNGGAADPSCAFKTVTAALAAIGAAGGVTISIAGPSTLDPAETYPLTIPVNTTVTATGGHVVVKAMGGAGFMFKTTGSGIDGTIDPTSGVVVEAAGASQAGIAFAIGTDKTNFLRGVTVQNAAAAGVRVGGTGSDVTIGEAVLVTSSKGAGLSIGDGGAHAFITVAAGQKDTAFVGNNVGISVSGNSSLTVAGVASAGPQPSGTVSVSKSVAAGIDITQSATGAPISLDGVTSFSNGASGLRIALGANITVRNSVFLANTLHGIHVFASAGGSGTAANIDLGKGGSFGLNTVQDSVVSGLGNKGVGICFNPPNATNLLARGNLFGPMKDCSTTAAMLIRVPQCVGGVDLGVSAGTVDTSMCTN